jgi:hypothetical protein
MRSGHRELSARRSPAGRGEQQPVTRQRRSAGISVRVQGALLKLALRVDERVVLRQIAENHAEELSALIDRNRSYLREWLPWLDNGNGIHETTDSLPNVTLVRAFALATVCGQSTKPRESPEDRCRDQVGHYQGIHRELFGGAAPARTRPTAPEGDAEDGPRKSARRRFADLLRERCHAEDGERLPKENTAVTSAPLKIFSEPSRSVV